MLLLVIAGLMLLFGGYFSSMTAARDDNGTPRFMVGIVAMLLGLVLIVWGDSV